jgi:hypothetical protein
MGGHRITNADTTRRAVHMIDDKVVDSAQDVKTGQSHKDVYVLEFREYVASIHLVCPKLGRVLERRASAITSCYMPTPPPHNGPQ